jgi:hypothetical protein
MTSPVVSCIVATYNLAHYLPAALDSALGQDYPADALEIIVVDDGSTDDTASVVAPYLDRVRYVHKENGGHLSTFNRGIAEASGDYIALLDGDDLWLPHKTREQVAMLESRPEIGLVHGDMQVVDGAGRVTGESFFASMGIEEYEGDLLGRLIRGNVVTTSSLMVRAVLRDRYHPIPAWGRAQDWWLALRVAEVASIGCLTTPVTRYRQHGANLNLGRSPEQRAELFRREIPVRRWALTEARTERLSGRELLTAFVSLETVVADVSRAFSSSPQALLAVDGEQRARSRERRALAGQAEHRGDRTAALRHLIAAAAHDPTCAETRRELISTGRRLDLIAGPPPAETAPGPEPGLAGARALVTLADAAELAADHALLAAYGREFSGADDATLVVHVDDEPGRVERLAEAVSDAGLDGDDAADILAVPIREADRRQLSRLAARSHAVLSAALPTGPLAALPCVAASGVQALGALDRRDRPSYVVNICAPDWGVARAWGDLHFARAVQQELHRQGLPCAIHVMEQWNRSKDPARYDVVVHLKGLSTYVPNPAQTNVLWNISHPDRLTALECEDFDVVFVASHAFAAALAGQTSTPVHTLEQATDPDVFFPEHDAAHERELVFVGNSRKVMRRILADLCPTDRDLAIWGGDWEGLVDPSYVAGTHLPNDQVRRAYSSAGLVLNDHWDDMREHGFASNRLYDAVACGALVLSDHIEGLESRFGGAVVTYRSPGELRDLIDHFLAHPEERAARGASGRARVLAHHTFAHRVAELLAGIESARVGRGARVPLAAPV